MAKINVYLNFKGNCEEAFQFYGNVFKTANTGIYRYSDIPAEPDMPPLSEEDKNKVMHTSIKINDNTMLMGADVIEGFGGKLSLGNSTYIMHTSNIIQNYNQRDFLRLFKGFHIDSS